MIRTQRWQTASLAIITACALVACGGGGGGGYSNANNPTPTPTPVTPVPTEPGAPALTGVTAQDGLNWLNFRRGQIALPLLTRNTQIDTAAQAHSDYQRLNNTVTHTETAGNPGFTGASEFERLQAAGYVFPQASYAYGEVISASTSVDGVYLAEELITAIYHRFVIFEPVFKEIGAGSATSGSGYSYFTANFTARNGYGLGLGTGQIVGWPVSGQTNVLRNFFSDFESPDPVANQNEVGYPVSVHVNIDQSLLVTSFTIHPHGEADVAVKLLAHANDQHTPDSAAAIIPLAVLRASTVYDVAFAGTSNGTPVSKSWSFTTRP